jgi:hypothetical protein
MEAIMKHTHTIVIDQLLSSIKSIAGNTNTQHHNDATIKDFTGITGACKLELSIVGSAAILTRITGDVEGVIGWSESDLIGKNLLKLMGVDKDTINNSFRALSKNGFAYKENKFYAKDGSEVNTKSILMWREHEKKIVEIIWKG